MKTVPEARGPAGCRYAGRPQGRLNGMALEPLVQEVAHRHGKRPEQLDHIFSSQAPDLSAVPSQGINSPGLGSGMDGGTLVITPERALVMRESQRSRPGYLAASVVEKRAISAAAFFGSRHSVRPSPSGWGAWTIAGLDRNFRPCFRKRRSETISGRNNPLSQAPVFTLKPGKTSSLAAAPPSTPRPSKNKHLQPGFCQVSCGHQAVVPPPMTMAS